jgi:DNA (cytosine-5)-methyltransferase 1
MGRSQGTVRRRLLDLFCGGGAAAYGYSLAAEFDIVGVDRSPQPRYPFAFIQADATTFPLDGFDAYHAAPPCQDHSQTQSIGGDHGTAWMLPHTIARFEAQDKPWVVENVKTAPLPHQDDLFGAHGIELCGCMFDSTRGLIYEARRFQTSFPATPLFHWHHSWPLTKMGRQPKEGECMQLTGHFTDVAEGRRRTGCHWMNRDELAQAHAPVFTRYIGGQLLKELAA